MVRERDPYAAVRDRLRSGAGNVDPSAPLRDGGTQTLREGRTRVREVTEQKTGPKNDPSESGEQR